MAVSRPAAHSQMNAARFEMTIPGTNKALRTGCKRRRIGGRRDFNVRRFVKIRGKASCCIYHYIVAIHTI